MSVASSAKSAPNAFASFRSEAWAYPDQSESTAAFTSRVPTGDRLVCWLHPVTRARIRSARGSDRMHSPLPFLCGVVWGERRVAVGGVGLRPLAPPTLQRDVIHL